jgi:hypothetical protein
MVSILTIPTSGDDPLIGRACSPLAIAEDRELGA